MNQNEHFGSPSKRRRNAANVFEHFRTDGYKRSRLKAQEEPRNFLNFNRLK